MRTWLNSIGSQLSLSQVATVLAALGIGVQNLPEGLAVAAAALATRLLAKCSAHPETPR